MRFFFFLKLVSAGAITALPLSRSKSAWLRSVHTFSKVYIGDRGVVPWCLVQSDWRSLICNNHVAACMSHTYLPYTCDVPRVGVCDPPDIIVCTSSTPSPGIQCPSLAKDSALGSSIRPQSLLFNDRANQSV